jgi:hypothetical protein
LTKLGQGTVSPIFVISTVPSSSYLASPVYNLYAPVEITSGLVAGANTLIAHAEDLLFGGAAATGGRVTHWDVISNVAVTSSVNTIRDYVAHQSSAFSAFGDGGTNTAAAAKGNFFGSAPSVNLLSGATNVNEAIASEANINLSAGSTVKDAVGFNVVTNVSASVSVRPASLYSAFGVTAAATITANHLRIAFCIHDHGGSTPVGPTTTSLFGSSLATVGQVSVSSGIDLTDFTFAGNAFKSTGFTVSGAGKVSQFQHVTPVNLLNVVATSVNNTALVSSFLRFDSAFAYDITGFAAQDDGYVLRVYNAAAFNMNIIDRATSTAANQIITMTGGTVSTSGVGVATFIYSVTDTKWLLCSIQA